MSDYWNDPPEAPELPECCGDYMAFNESAGECRCPRCGRVVLPEADAPELELEQPEVPGDLLAPPPPPACPHGNAWGSCHHCDAESDRAFDAAREGGRL